MMMRALEAGGLAVDRQPENEVANALFRNIHGAYAHDGPTLNGEFVNSYKLVHTRYFADVPPDFKLIYINRTVAATLASWAEINVRCEAEARPMGSWLDDTQTRARDRYYKWETIVAARPDFLRLNYDAVVADPAAAMAGVGQHINTSTFAFDENAAAATVDGALYIDRRGG
jgi:hypothetical protein